MTLDAFVGTLPKFSAIKIDTIEADLTQLLADNLSQIETLLAQDGPYTWANLMQPMEGADDTLGKFWSPISHLNSVMNNDALRTVYEACIPALSDYGTQVSHNRKLYEAIQSIVDGDEYATLDEAQQKILDNELRDFKLSGVSLSADKKEQFANISKALSELANKFDNNVLDATKAWTREISDEAELIGIPDLMKQQFKMAAEQQDKKGWLVTLEMPSYIAVIMHADNRQLRQDIYEAYTTRASDQGPNAGQWDNSEVIQDILTNRLALAHLLDFKNYAEISLATKMVKETQQVLDFLNQLVDASLDHAGQEFTELKEFAKDTLGVDTFEAWDVTYASEKLREQRYAISQEELRPYFPEAQVIKGLFEIVGKLFGVTLKPIKNADTWHPDVTVYAMYNAHDELIAAFYFDLYARQNKRGGAWMDDCQGRRRTNGDVQLPVAYVTCNFAGPTGDVPALFTHDEVVTLFHEFGHATQHLLTKIDYADVSGINGVPWDAVEVASQFLENWAWQRESVAMISKHYKTGEALPDALFDKMIRARNFQSAMVMMRQLEFGLFDFELHLSFDKDETEQVQHILNKVRERVTVVPVPSFNRFQNGFSHIFAGGYAAGYYSYKWAEVMAADAFGLFLEEGIFDQATSKKYRETFLESGGAKEPADLFETFRGRAPQIEALLQQSGITQ
ncbi:MAG: oligopeptidase A [Coxiella sp. (in: Bacteria)]|nr:MAG: oligopeptidase A [Coxiella sp. (in: g-proteobacteria)]